MAMSPWHKPMSQSQKPPDRMQPVPEQVAGTNFPYRGMETHGVDPGDVQITVDPEEADYGTTVAIPLEPEESEPDPVPVRIVSEGGNELKEFRVIREYCRGGESSRRIIGQDEDRSKVRIKNLHASDSLYVSDIAFNDIGMGYPIASGSELELTSKTPVYARAGSTNDIPVAMIVEWTQDR
jgi:hypothetical protein